QQIKVFDVATGKVVRTLSVDAEWPCAVAASPDGKWCAHSQGRGTVKVRDALTGAEARTLQGLDGRIHYLVFSPDRLRLLGVDRNGAMKIWDSATGHEIAAARLSNIYVNRIRFSPDGKRLAVVGDQLQSLAGEARVLDAENGRELLLLRDHPTYVMDAAF